MKVAVCSAQSYDRQFLLAANRELGHELVFFDSRLSEETRHMVAGFPAVCVFVNDTLNAVVLKSLVTQGTRLIALRCAGFNNVEIQTASSLGLHVVRVPAYSPHSVAEHSVGLILALNRHLPQAYNRVRNGNFTLQGLFGFELRGKTVGIVGTGRIGTAVIQILHGFGCRLIAHDPQQNPECISLGVAYAAVNVNTATQAELQTLKGITAAKAKAIIDYRSKAGSFKSTDDLEKVEGINAHTVDMQQLRKDISLTGPTVLKNEGKPAIK